MKLTVQNAEIKTATVEVKTLTISGKQVTLAVFRQLQQSFWLDDSGAQRGVAWGRVNYCPDRRCKTDSWGCEVEHVHIVWQLGVELRHCMLRRPKPGSNYGSEEFRRGHREAWQAACRLPQLFIAV